MGVTGRSASLLWLPLDTREDLPADRRPPPSQSGSVSEVGRNVFILVVRRFVMLLGPCTTHCPTNVVPSRSLLEAKIFD